MIDQSYEPIASESGNQILTETVTFSSVDRVEVSEVELLEHDGHPSNVPLFSCGGQYGVIYY